MDVAISFLILDETEKAFQVWEELHLQGIPCWLPKSQINNLKRSYDESQLSTATIPEWLLYAKQKAPAGKPLATYANRQSASACRHYPPEYQPPPDIYFAKRSRYKLRQKRK